MKNTIFLLAIALTSVQLSAQSTCEDLRKENEYLKRALLLNNPVIEVRNGDLNFSIVKVEGNSRNHVVTIEIIVKNKRRNIEAFAAKVKSIVDINGMEYQVDKAYIGLKDATTFAFTDLRKNTPLKCRYVFKGVQPVVKALRLFNYPVEYHIPGADAFDFENKNAEFKNLSIVWN